MKAAEGGQKAAAALKASKKKANLRVKITGARDGGTIRAAKLKLQ